MHAIEFEATAHQHTIRLPDSVPDGTPLRVLLLSQAPFEQPESRDLKFLLASITEGLSESDIARPRDLGRGATEWPS